MDDIKNSILHETGGSNLAFRTGDPITKGHQNATFDPKRLDKLPVRVRPSEPGDTPLIYRSWLKSYHGQNLDQPKRIFYRLHRPVVKRLLESAITLVACDQEKGDDIYAWLCAQRTSRFLVLHYAYTKASFRRFGLQRALVKGFDYHRGEPTLTSHRGWVSKDLKRKGHTLLYVPYLQHEGGLTQVEEIYADPSNAIE